MTMTDLTLRALTAQLMAMGCAQYEIGVRDAANGKMMNKSWSVKKLLNGDGKKAPPWRWLKHMNVKGNDIYVRPAGEWHHLILVDDLTRDALERMRNDGVEPALVVETSPQNFQAWVSVAQPTRKIVPPEIRGAIARRLAREYDADPASADAKHYGRLSGFTNRKEKHKDDSGRQPWVLLREHTGVAAAAVADLVAAAEAEIAEKEQQAEEQQQWDRDQEQARQAPIREASAQPVGARRRDPVDEYRGEMTGLLKRFGVEIADQANPKWTMSKCDFIVSAKMIRRGHDPEAVAAAMREASPRLDERKAGHVEDYVRRTVRAAAAAVAREPAKPNRPPRPSVAAVDQIELDEFFGFGRGSTPGPR